MEAKKKMSPALPVLIALAGVALAVVLLSQRDRQQTRVPQDSPLAVMGNKQSGPVRPFRTENADDWSVHHLAVSPDGLTIATAYTEEQFTDVPGSTEITSTVSLWRQADWERLASFVYHEILDGIWFAPDGGSLVVTTVKAMEWIRLPDGMVTRQIAGRFRKATFSPDGSTIATMASEDQVVLLRAEDGSVIRTLDGAMGSDGLAFSPDGQLLAVAGCIESRPEPGDYLVQLWKVSDGTLVKSLIQEKAQFIWSGMVTFSPDGQVVAWVGWGDDVRLFRVSDGELLHTLEFTYVEDLAFSPDSQLMAGSAAVDLAVLWRVSDGAEIADFVNEGGIYGGGGKVFDVEFSPDGHTLYGGTSDSTVRMWRVP